jgi:hypothetical protein
MKLCLRIALGLSMMVMTASSQAQPHDPEPEARKIATRFVKLTGSEDNALALVLALRHGVPVQLFPAEANHARTLEPLVLEIDAPPMVWNDVRIALLHVQDALVRAGHTRPTLEDVRAALLGGEVIQSDGHRVSLRGVLPMRIDGMSWVDVARESSPAFPQPVLRTGH